MHFAQGRASLKPSLPCWTPLVERFPTLQHTCLRRIVCTEAVLLTRLGSQLNLRRASIYQRRRNLETRQWVSCVQSKSEEERRKKKNEKSAAPQLKTREGVRT